MSNTTSEFYRSEIKKWCDDHNVRYIDLTDSSRKVIRVIYDILTRNIMTSYHMGPSWDHTKDKSFRMYQIYNYTVRGNIKKAKKIYESFKGDSSVDYYENEYDIQFKHLMNS